MPGNPGQLHFHRELDKVKTEIIHSNDFVNYFNQVMENYDDNSAPLWVHTLLFAGGHWSRI